MSVKRESDTAPQTQRITISPGVYTPLQPTPRVTISPGVYTPPQPTQRIHIVPQPRTILPPDHPPLTQSQQISHDRLKSKWAEKRCSLPRICPLCRREIENTVFEATASDCEFHCSWPDCEYEWR